MSNKNTILSLNSKWQKSSVEFTNTDISLEQYFIAFKGLLVQQTWSERQINECIIELADKLRND